MSDFAFEPVRGLPEMLPEGERLLWQGAPSWQDLAVNAFHARKVIIYFGVMSVLQLLAQVSVGTDIVTALKPLLWLMPMGLVAAAILTALAYVSARTTVYTITDKRLVFRVGMALPVTINVPFKVIASASVRLFANGVGDIPVALLQGNKIEYLMLWPHAKPWEFVRPEPTLRSIPDADRVASLLASALAGEMTVRLSTERQPMMLTPDALAA